MHDHYTALIGEDNHAVEGKIEQGFIDQCGNFLTREEAWKVAEAADQIIRTGPGFSGPMLYSENLY